MKIMSNFKLLQVSRKNPDMTNIIMPMCGGTWGRGEGRPKLFFFYVTAVNFGSLHYLSCQIVMDKKALSITRDAGIVAAVHIKHLEFLTNTVKNTRPCWGWGGETSFLSSSFSFVTKSEQKAPSQ